MIKYLRITSLCLFCFSLICPVYSTTEVIEEPAVFNKGLGMLAMGWITVLNGGVALTWFANPFIIVAFSILKKHPIVSCILSTIAILIALCFLNGGELIYSLERGDMGSGYITHIKIGYWLWLSSMVVLLTASIFEIRRIGLRQAE